MKPRTAITGIVLLLLAVELVRRLGASATCYVDLRYNPNSFLTDRDQLWSHCAGRHLLFPFRL